MECGLPFTDCGKYGGGVFVKDGHPLASNVGDCGAVLYIK
jgi:hypothetical protein